VDTNTLLRLPGVDGVAERLRMIGRNPGLDREIVKHRGLGIDFAAHRCSAWGSGIRLGQADGGIVHWVLHQPARGN